MREWIGRVDLITGVFLCARETDERLRQPVRISFWNR